MRQILLLLILAGCTDGPDYLKYRDKLYAQCASDCAPRKMKTVDKLTHVCHCVDEQEK